MLSHFCHFYVEFITSIFKCILFVIYIINSPKYTLMFYKTTIFRQTNVLLRKVRSNRNVFRKCTRFNVT